LSGDFGVAFSKKAKMSSSPALVTVKFRTRAKSASKSSVRARAPFARSGFGSPFEVGELDR